MKIKMKTIWKVLTTLLLVLLLVAIAFPFFFRDRINAEFKKAIDERIEGEVDYGDISLSIFKSFPDLNVQIEDLRISGKELVTNQHDLFNSKSVSFGIDIMSLIRNQDSIEVKSFNLDHPVLHVLVDQSGSSNYEIYQPAAQSSSTASSGALKLNLNNYTINNADINYQDVTSGIKLGIDDMDHSGDLKYNDNLANWNATTKAKDLNYTQNSLRYLKDIAVDWDTQIDIDLTQGKYTFGENKLRLNDLALSLIGYVDQNNPGWDMDLKFDAAENSFKNFVSLLPNIYSKKFNQVKASGNLGFNGFLKGNYDGTKNIFPQYGIDFNVADGSFQYPGKPLALNNINTNGIITSQKSQGGIEQINIPVFGFNLNNKPFNGKLLLNNLSQTPTYDTEIKGTIDLADVYQAYPMETIDALSGVLNIDAKISGSADAEKVADAIYQGTAEIQKLSLQAKDQPVLKINNAQADLKNDYISVHTLNGQIGNSDFKGQAEVRQLMSAFTSEIPMEVKANINGRLLDLNEFITEEEVQTTTDLSNVNDWRRRAQFNLTSQYDKVNYANYNIKDINFSGNGSLETFALKNLSGNVQNSPIQLKGDLQNIYDYTFGEGELKGQLDFESSKMVLENWMQEEAPATGESSLKTVYTIVPPRVDLDIDVKSEQVSYTNIELKKVSGKLHIQDQKIVIKDAVGSTLGGQFLMDGLYGFTGEGQPDFNIKYDLSKFSFEQTFANIESFKLIAPIGKYLDGVYNSNLIMEGKLGEGYMPDLAALSASGFLETLHGSIRNFGPIQVAAQKLNISSLDEINMDYTRNWFEIKDGFCVLQPFDKKIEDIDMNISGRHKIMGDMDYKLRLNVPIEKFEKLGVPKIIKGKWNELAGKLEGAGIQVPGMDEVIVDVFIKGSIKNPKVDLKIVNFKEKSTGDIVDDIVTDIKEQVKDTVNTIIKDTKDKVRDTVTQVVTTVTDSVKVKVNEEIDDIKDEVKDKVEEEIKNRVDSTLQDSAKAIIKDVIGDDAEEEIDKLKDKLGGWNPFNKKN